MTNIGKVTKDPACGVPVDPDKTQFKAEKWGKTYYFCCHYCMRTFLETPRVAYFSMEIAVKNEMKTYSGGLGVLAGDVIRSCADLRIPLIAVTLVSSSGYLKQKLTPDGWQMDYPDEWNPADHAILLPNRVEVPINGRNIAVQCWIYDYESVTGGVVPVIFLDTNVEGNSSEDKEITSRLYGGDVEYRLKQEIVLGIGGFRMLKSLEINLKKFHMNEGHSSLLTLELFKQEGRDVDEVKDHCVFTTHTPVAAAFDRFPYEMVERLMGDELPIDVLRQFGGQDELNMTLLALNMSKFTNGVTEAHMEYSQKLFPRYRIYQITNGVHSHTWTCEHFGSLFDKHIPSWEHENELLVRADEIPSEEIWEAHVKAKQDLVNFVDEKTGAKIDLEVLTLGFARRATAYKRAGLIFSDLERLKTLRKKGSLQLIFAGKAHPRDLEGKKLIQEICGDILQMKDQIKAVYLEDYNMDMAAVLTSGVDVWLNTPLPPMEASGTSGMKAAHNGVVNFSVLDGWWIEGCIEGVTGWSIGPKHDELVGDEERKRMELEDLYGKLQFLILPKYYEDRDQWVDMMKKSISKVAYYFNSHRMMRRYVTEAYL